MDRVHLRQQLQKHKTLLFQLYSGKANNSKVLNSASDEELAILLKLLHLLGDGEVGVSAKHAQSIKTAKRESKLEKFGASRKDLITLLHCDRATKLKFIKSFSSLFPALLHKLFNKD